MLEYGPHELLHEKMRRLASWPVLGWGLVWFAWLSPVCGTAQVVPAEKRAADLVVRR